MLFSRVKTRDFLFYKGSDKLGYIYKITNLINNKVYIGQTRATIQKRYKAHISTAFNENSKDYNNYLYRAIRKYGKENFIVNEIEGIDNSLLNDREMYWIDYYDSTNRDIGYNLTLGGGGHKNPKIDDELINKLWNEGYSHTEISKIVGSKITTVSLHLKNNPTHTKEEIKKRRYAKTFEKIRRIKVDQYDLDGNFIKHFDSAFNASIETNICADSIRRACNGNVKSAGGYLWCYSGEKPHVYINMSGKLKMKK